MKKFFYYFTVMFAAVLLTTSCSDDNNDNPSSKVKYTKAIVKLTMPENVSNVKSIKELTAKFHNVTTGLDTTIVFNAIENNNEAEMNRKEYSLDAVTIPEGLYNVDIKGNVVYNDEVHNVAKIGANVKGKAISGENADIAMECYIDRESNGFVISEIFAAGTSKPDGKQYRGDAYFRITNNSDEILYADGLFIAESKFNDMLQEDYMPDIRKEAMPVGYLTKLPGRHGVDKKIAVKPGESLIICDNAINHTVAELNPNSFDLTTADYEWYDESTNPSFTDIDNKDVPNMERLFTYSATVWAPHNRGFHSYAIGFLEVDNDTYIKGNTYQYDYYYIFVNGDYTKKMEFKAMKVPNSWIVDAVNLSVKDKKQWDLIDPSFDKGYTWFSENESDKNRYGKAVRRKYDANAKKLIDTNDSKNDFELVKADPKYIFK